MTENCLTYIELNPLHAMRQMPKNRSSVPFAWRLTVVILGVSCFCLLLTTGILGYMVFQVCRAAQSQDAFLKNVTTVPDSKLENTAFSETPHTSGSECNTCKNKWSCCGEDCYYFSYDLKNFNDSQNFCKQMGATLLKIEDEKELNFIQNQISSVWWTGLSRTGVSSSWTWEDNSAPLPKLFSDWDESKSGNCGSIRRSSMTVSDCSRYMRFICEKKIVCLAP
ncbi:C-type lectin domain family 9 member A-like [Otolemur garnettii]|uniref:C-type lectin domain family 9 member A-like n=1 Tax=Otolemur garnettii TaxID=30611 RepID=UPI000C7F3D61|nr:C-type lectin domain family 9 member A-like [Otolemur garnettii]